MIRAHQVLFRKDTSIRTSNPSTVSITTQTMQAASEFMRKTKKSWATFTIDDNVLILRRLGYIKPEYQYMCFDQDSEELIFRSSGYTDNYPMQHWLKKICNNVRFSIVQLLLPR